MGLMGFILLVAVVMLFEARSRIGRLEHRVREAQNAIKCLQENSPASVVQSEVISIQDDPVPKEQLSAEAQQENASAASGPAVATATEVIPLQPTLADEQLTEQVREPAKAYRMPARVISSNAEPIAELIGAPSDNMNASPAGASAPINRDNDPTESSAPSKFPEVEQLAQDRKPEPVPARGLSFNFEDLFGRRLPIWAGGITLAIAGVLIVKYAIDAGFFQRVFTPWVQVLSGFLFGTGLIAGAELAHRKAAHVNDPRISQALSGAGIATLYSVFLVAANGYGLIGPMAAFLGLATVTAGALGLSIRFGAPSALLGLAGGLAAPAMVGGVSANVPILAVYLALTIAGLSGVSRMQRWPWLGLAALVGGAGWSLWMILATTALDTLASLSIGGFVLLLAIALPMLTLREAQAAFMRTVAALVGAAQLAILVAMGGFQPLHWGLFALLAAAGQWLSYRDRSFDIIPTISLGLSVFLLAIWPEPAASWFAGIGLALASILGLPLLMKIWQTPVRLQLALELCGLAVAAPLLTFWQFYINDHSRDAVFAVVAAAAAVLPVVAIITGWNRNDRLDDTRFSWLTITAGALLMISTSFALPVWQVPLGFAAIAAATLFLGERSGDPRIERNATGMALVAGLALIVTMNGDWQQLASLITGRVDAVDIHAVLRWSGLAALFALFTIRAKNPLISVASHAVVGVLAYGTAAQILPGWILPILLGSIAVVMLLISNRTETAFGGRNADIFAAVALPLLLMTMTPDLTEIVRLTSGNKSGLDFHAVIRWSGLTALFALFALRSRGKVMRLASHWFAATLTYGTLAQIVPGWALPLALCTVATGTLLVGLRRSDKIVEAQAVVLGLLAIPLLIITQSYGSAEWQRLVGLGMNGFDALAALRWGVLSGAAIFYAFRSRIALVRHGAQALAAAFGYGALAQVVPATFVPLIAPAALVGLAHWGKRRVWPCLAIASAVFVIFLIGWAAYPLSIWGTKAALSLSGIPMAVDGKLLSFTMIATRLLCPAAMLGLAVWISRGQLPDAAKTACQLLTGILFCIAAHSLYRLAFTAMFGTDFITYGLSQRLVWSAILIGAGWILWRKAQGTMRTRVAPAMVAASVLHLAWYSLLLHNPLWTAQAVGVWPIFNLLIPTFGLLVTALHLLRQMFPEKLATAAMRPSQLVHMMLICLFAWASLRQAFHGSLLTTSGVSAAEDILRSILGIVLAIGFLLWGIRVQQRDWRIVSLVLLLAATTKVFLFDTSGLEGLMRIGSFVALGFSLIGIGWLYSRQLGRDAKAHD